MRPTRLLVLALGLLALPGAALAFGLSGPGPLLGASVFVLALAAIDFARLRLLPIPAVERRLPRVVAVGHPLTVELALSGGLEAQRLEVFDLHPAQWTVENLPQRLSLPAQGRSVLAYTLHPQQRGAAHFEGCALRLHSPWRLWTRLFMHPLRSAVRVYPDFARVSHLALVGTDRASRVIGAHQHRRRGEGTEFHQLREYRTGDSLRQIDWKATRRAQKLISRDYQDERNQQVVLLVDTGRRMLAHDGSLSHFDHALNASLLVAFIALRQGDSVGLMASGGESRWMPPARGLGAIDRLLDTVYDLQPQPVATDYIEAAMQLGARQPRRALVLIVTNARDEDIEDLLAGVRQLQRRHLVCVASLREAMLDELLEQPPERVDTALEASAAAQYLEQRQRVHTALRAQGATVLDVTATQLPGALVDHYLAMKRAGRL
ncbi:DUF58 domain-containing protein [Aquimonas voraii]|uniref:Uncharacterized conserved protein, DUF58 family, contains vWF domain n=1 Tax=Aquimonas voraii TaxID=265719 RepID=A0A1G6UMM3_9GAMM|nr:DUF58 domain-containing protein [Aquimonas voraii]SDD42539.1 Uncharacterized conserved protein, DUF58 family, contains vWF domain [Aquimonas voraii]